MTTSIGELIAEAFDKVGKDGVITVEESNTLGTELEFTEGMQFDKGYLSPYFVTDAERMEAVLDDPYILIHSGQDLALSPTSAAAGEGHRRPASRCSSSPRTSRAKRCRPWSSTRSAAPSPSVAVKAPGFGDRRKAILQDIAILTGGQVVTADLGLKLDSVGLDDARHAPAASSSPRTTRRSSTAAATSRGVEGRVSQIKAEIENTDSDWDREKLQERLAKLAGGVCVIKVGAATEVELKEKKHRIEDAISATRAAIEEGIIAGGGSALVHAAAGARRRPRPDRRRGHRRRGSSGVALDEPLRWIAANARPTRATVVVAKVARAGAGQGFNAATGEYGDLMAQGVIDPVKVTRSALANAASIAAMLLTTETLDRREAGRRGRRPRAATATSTEVA